MHELPRLGAVHVERTRGGTRRGAARAPDRPRLRHARVPLTAQHGAQLLHHCAHARTHVLPRAHVLGLLLCPHQLRVRVRTERGGCEVVVREGRHLLEANDGDVSHLARTPRLRELIVQRAGADDDAAHVLARRVQRLLGDDEAEGRAGPHLLDGAVAGAVVQEILRRGHNERLAEAPDHLSSQDVEEVGRRGDVDDDEVVRLLRVVPQEGGHEGAPLVDVDGAAAVGVDDVKQAHDALLARVHAHAGQQALAIAVFQHARVAQHPLQRRHNLRPVDRAAAVRVDGAEARIDGHLVHRSLPGQGVRLVVAQLQEALDARAAVVGPLTLKAVRQQHDH
mmetsp:Transcript_11264/g.39232  ORF Transcript_11264/g.39232 Transcript_11264/m.39232 type:complete len:337 (+) Transcript_11264:147-1157(+)